MAPENGLEGIGKRKPRASRGEIIINDHRASQTITRRTLYEEKKYTNVKILNNNNKMIAIWNMRCMFNIGKLANDKKWQGLQLTFSE